MAPSLILLVPALVSAAPQPASQTVQLRIDHRFELISIACRLADFHEYRGGRIEDYNAAVDAHFAPFKRHKAVLMLQELRKDGICYDAIPSLAVRAKDAIRFTPAMPLDEAHGLDGRWKPGKAKAFLKAMADFARDAKAEAFFQAQAPFYEQMRNSCQEGLLAHLDQPWYQRTFGSVTRDTFSLCIAPLNGSGNYGPSAPNALGGEDRYAYIGTGEAPSGQCPSFDKAYLPTLVHEFLHGFANPWVERHLAELKSAGEALNAPVTEEMRHQAYGSFETALRESLVRAFTIRYFREQGLEGEAQRQETVEQERAFYWVKDLADVLGEFSAHRDRYPDFESFSPRLVAAYQALGAEAPKRAAAWRESRRAAMEVMFAKGPKLVSMEPTDGCKDVDPTTSVLRFVFDRPMAASMGVVKLDAEFPEVLGKGVWDADGKVLSFAIKLKAGTTYRLGLNAEGFYPFQDRDRNPLCPVALGFSTKVYP